MSTVLRLTHSSTTVVVSTCVSTLDSTLNQFKKKKKKKRELLLTVSVFEVSCAGYIV